MSMYARFQRHLFTISLLATLALLPSCDASPRRTVFFGGPIVTVDRENRVVEALGIEGDRIQAVGSADSVRDWGGAGAREIDLAGRALLPGFIDAHGHFPGAGLYALYADLNSPPIGTSKTIADIQARLSEKLSQIDEGDWIIGSGYDDTLIEERRHPTRDDLDRVSTRHPIMAWHVSLHMAVVNSMALELMGVDASTPDPEGGVIRRRAGSREPDGLLEENAMELVTSLIGTPSPIEGLAIMREASRRYLAAGVTTAQSGYTERSLMQSLDWASWLGLIPLRLVLFPSAIVADEHLAGDFDLHRFGSDEVRAGAIKLIADGSIQGYTGYLTEPYFVPNGDDPEFRGYPRMETDELHERVGRYHEAGLQIAIHGNGDAAIDHILDAIEAAQERHPREDSRHIIIHAQMAREDQLDRMLALGVIPSFFNLHVYYWGDRHRDIFMGPRRAARISPARSAADRGIPFTLHADSPVVPMDPLKILHTAVNRLTASGAVLGPEQRIDVGRALRGVTIDAARQHFEETEKGSLEVGKLADLVMLSRSPFDDPARIDEIRVEETWIAGREVYGAGAE